MSYTVLLMKIWNAIVLSGSMYMCNLWNSQSFDKVPILRLYDLLLGSYLRVKIIVVRIVCFWDGSHDPTMIGPQIIHHPGDVMGWTFIISSIWLKRYDLQSYDFRSPLVQVRSPLDLLTDFLYRKKTL